MQHMFTACLDATDEARLLLLKLCWAGLEHVSQPAEGPASFSNHGLVSCTCLLMHAKHTQDFIMHRVIKEV